MFRSNAILALMIAVFKALAADSNGVAVRLSNERMHDLLLKEIGPDTYELQTTGDDPYVLTLPLTNQWDSAQQRVLSFDYRTRDGTDHLQIFTLPLGDEDHSLKVEGLGISEGWSARALDLEPLLKKSKSKPRALRLDLGSSAGKVIQLRSIQLRPPTQAEEALAEQRRTKREHEQRFESQLRDYLQRSYPCSLTNIEVSEQEVRAEGNVGNEKGDLFLAEVPMFANVTELREFPALIRLNPDAAGRFTVRLNRRLEIESPTSHDHLLCRWAVVRKTGVRIEPLSPARYPDLVQAKWDVSDEKPRNKKGLGAFWPSRPVQDVTDLNIAGVTVNISLSSFMRTAPASEKSPAGRTTFNYAGQIWAVDDSAVGQLDQTLIEAARRQLLVSAIILLPQVQAWPDRAFGKLVAHPDADPAGIYVMPNTGSQAGLGAYAAALDFLAGRYSRPDKRYGRIHHWIMHNEVDAGWEWTNAGEKSALLYLDLYHKSMRAMHLIARQYNPHAKVFISLTHHWSSRANHHCYAGRELLEWLLAFSRAEGDFDWAIAYHPYPEDLRNPRVWEDKAVDFTFNTPKITFKNLEVLDAWVKQPSTFFLESHQRTVHLTEQGLNSPDYGAKSLQEQAAGFAYAWNKVKRLDAIELFHYHNWVDNRAEGGLRIGLRKFPDDKEDPGGRKPIWFVYQAAGTEKEEAATEFAKRMVGVPDWSQIIFPVKIQ